MESAKWKSYYRLFFYGFFSVTIALAAAYYVHTIHKKIPEHIYINENEQVVLSMGIPATGEIMLKSEAVDVSAVSVAKNADLSKPVTFVTGNVGHYTMKINLFGWITVKQIDVEVVDEKYLYPGGFQIGMYLKTDGVLVVNTEHIISQDGEDCIPWENLINRGDYIVKVNGETVTEKEDLAEQIGACQGEMVVLEIRREGSVSEVTVQPVLGQDQQYKLGLWVKDDAQGIGTITYIDSDNHFAALGHGISDENTGNMMEISQGRVYGTYILSIVKGQNGKPGELLGAIDYKESNRMGIINGNGASGIQGDFSVDLKSEYHITPMKVGYSYMVHEGPAKVRLYYKGDFHDYDIRIDHISNGQEKNLTFQVTSTELLELTNGIVQGMSGCPIIQDGNVIGAVTHVFVDDCTKGYGIFIESMLGE